MPAPLRIAVLGAGRIGSAFAFQLARAGGHEVTVIARPGSVRLAQLRRDQAVVDVKGQSAPVRVEDRLDEAVAYDLVVVTLLGHQVEPVLPALQRSAAKTVQFMFNTFTPERLQAALGVERCALGMPFLQSTLDVDGRLKATIGVGGQKSMMDRPQWVEVFAAAGLPAALEPGMPLWLRCHAPVCVAFESVAAAGQRRGGGAAWSEALALARGVQAAFDLIAALGDPIYPRSKARIRSSPAWMFAAVLWFMSRIPSFRELLATGQVEAREILDAILAAAPPAFDAARLARIAAMRP